MSARPQRCPMSALRLGKVRRYESEEETSEGGDPPLLVG